MMRRIATVCVVLVSVATSSAAEARRRPTAAERAGIANAFKVPSRCSKVWVSQIDRHYASYEFNPKARNCARYGSNGIDIVRLRDSLWKDLGGMSDCAAGGSIRGVPSRIFAELTRA